MSQLKTERAYGQWVQIIIANEGEPLFVKHAKHSWGKFHVCGDKDVEINPEEINTYVAESGAEDELRICACGREGASSGTVGSLDLCLNEGEVVVASYSWSCPWGSHTNTSTFVLNPEFKENYQVEFEPGNLYGGALGQVRIFLYQNR